MANYSNATRKEQVLNALKSRPGEWFDGAALANEEVGGSEGLKRLRELKAEGWLIQMRKSPVQGSDQFQYRLAVQLRTDGSLAYYDPTLHPEDHQQKERIQNGGPQPRSDPAPARSDSAAQPTQSTWMDPNVSTPDTKWSDWKPSKKTRGTLEHVFWFRIDGNTKQRVVGAIGPDFNPSRWYWGVLIPANKTRFTPDKRVAHGYVEADGPRSARDAARDAVEACIQRLREEGLPV